MARYQAVINTDGYKLMPCSKKNWEAGTVNDFMLAINGWKSTERSLQEVRWRIEMLLNTHIIIAEILIGKNGLHRERTRLNIMIGCVNWIVWMIFLFRALHKAMWILVLYWKN